MELTSTTDLLNPNLDALEDDESPSLDVLAARRKNKNAQTLHSAADALSSENASISTSQQSITADDGPAPGSPQDLENEAAGEGAFNPETGEINFDCPCLGGMAHGPCGPQFREAFSCFVYSTEEPKGMDCIEKFQSMRDCFQEHPDVYKDELADDEEIDRELEQEKQELVGQIAERRKADLAAEEGTRPRNLLEEAAPEPREPRVKATRKIEPKQEQSQQKTEAASKPQPEAKHEIGQDQSGPMPADKENSHDGQRSQTVKAAAPPPVRQDADPVDQLIPKDAFDARDAKAK